MASQSMSGKVVKAFIGGTELPITSGSVTQRKQMTDATGSTSNGWEENIVGNRGLDFTLNFQPKRNEPTRVLSDAVFATPSDPDSEEQTVLLQLATGLKIQGPALLTFSINGDASTGAAIGGTITGKSNGAWAAVP